MHNTLKVAKWEIKRNMKNKSFVISLFLTPIIFLFFSMVPSFFDDSDEESAATQVFVNDELGIFATIKEMVKSSDLLNWDLQETDLEQAGMNEKLQSEENTAYIPLTESALANGKITVYTSEEMDGDFMNQVRFLEEPLQQLQIQQLGLSAEEMEVISRSVVFETTSVDEIPSEDDHSSTAEDGPVMERIVPGAFAGIILLSIIITGMMIFQSASQEKKDKIAEIILSSLTPEQLMQGKILGYFVLGITQVVVFVAFALPVVIWKTDIPIMDYLLVPELILLVGIAILGYLLFASLFVGIGATIEDISTSGNFQGIVLMLPFLPLIFIGPILSDPSGLIAQIGSYIPFTSPGVLLLRLSLLEEWPWMEVIISLAILIVSVWLFMKLAGKIFKTGILLYGKNATPKEIWKWIRA
ncbi:ABC transporter permease [Lentibacillus sp. Marseille-P4043]|uniref:ABC transporter permease n=1 Tax=Lentibacillus sp. Marseille-P4043 TaxID=2040293 RepID=UPI000D0B603E|nr:ABC transporter permease [Lentibacillus sp. Marseille-P4043]